MSSCTSLCIQQDSILAVNEKSNFPPAAPKTIVCGDSMIFSLKQFLAFHLRQIKTYQCQELQIY